MTTAVRPGGVECVVGACAVVVAQAAAAAGVSLARLGKKKERIYGEEISLIINQKRKIINIPELFTKIF